MGDIYFNGTALASEKKVKFNGTDMSNVYFNGTKIWTYYSETAQAFTSSSTYTLDAAETSVQYKLSGGGGGGGGAAGYTGATAGSSGGDTILKVLDSSGNVRQTIATASGGAYGSYGGGSRTRSGAYDFSIPSGWANPPWSSTVSDGGLGAQGSGEGNPSGQGGAAGSTTSGTYTINADGNDHSLQITIGGGGGNGGAGEAGQYAQSGNSGGAWLLYVIS
jgi:hypothetical protein